MFATSFGSLFSFFEGEKDFFEGGEASLYFGGGFLFLGEFFSLEIFWKGGGQR